jgi:hypothetical protein
MKRAIPILTLLLAVGCAWAVPTAPLRALALSKAATHNVTAGTVDLVLQSAVAATGNGNAMGVGGLSGIAVQVAGTFSATVTFEATVDGTNWVSLALFPSTGGTGVTSATTAGTWTGSVTGFDQFRGRVTWTSGTSVTVTAKATRAALGPGAAATAAVTQSGTWTVQPGNTANTTPWLVTPTASAAGGATSYYFSSAGGANQDATAMDAAQGTLYSFTASNTVTSARYVWLYNLASGATSASTVVGCLALPGITTGSTALINCGPNGIAFSTGISFRITTGLPGSSTAAASANDVLISASFR